VRIPNQEPQKIVIRVDIKEKKEAKEGEKEEVISDEELSKLHKKYF